VNVVCLVLVDGYVQVVTRQSPSLESGDDGSGASIVDGVTRFGGGVTLPCHVLKKRGGNVGNTHPTSISFRKERKKKHDC